MAEKGYGYQRKLKSKPFKHTLVWLASKIDECLFAINFPAVIVEDKVVNVASYGYWSYKGGYWCTSEAQICADKRQMKQARRQLSPSMGLLEAPVDESHRTVCLQPFPSVVVGTAPPQVSRI